MGNIWVWRHWGAAMCVLLRDWDFLGCWSLGLWDAGDWALSDDGVIRAGEMSGTWRQEVMDVGYGTVQGKFLPHCCRNWQLWGECG